MYAWFIPFFIGCILIGVVSEIFRTRCPSCRKFFGRRVLSQSRAREMGHFTRDHYHVNSAMECQCKFCGHQYMQTHRNTRRR